MEKRDIEKISVRRGLREKKIEKHIYILKKYSRVVDEKERGGKKCKKQSVRHMNTCVQRGEKEFFVMALVMGIILQLLAPRRKVRQSIRASWKNEFSRKLLCVCVRGGGAITVSALFSCCCARRQTSIGEKNTGGHCSFSIGAGLDRKRKCVSRTLKNFKLH